MPTTELVSPPSTSDQYRRPASANSTVAAGINVPRTRSMRARLRKRSCRCSSAAGTTPKDATMNPAAVAIRTGGRSGARKKRARGSAATAVARNPAAPRNRLVVLSWDSWSSESSRSVITALPIPNSLTTMMSPRYTWAIVTRPKSAGFRVRATISVPTHANTWVAHRALPVQARPCTSERSSWAASATSPTTAWVTAVRPRPSPSVAGT